MGHIWITYGSHMDHIWVTYGSHMDHIWVTYGSYMGHIGFIHGPQMCHATYHVITQPPLTMLHLAIAKSTTSTPLQCCIWLLRFAQYQHAHAPLRACINTFFESRTISFFSQSCVKKLPAIKFQ